jgi:hypothetical protein
VSAVRILTAYILLPMLVCGCSNTNNSEQDRRDDNGDASLGPANLDDGADARDASTATPDATVTIRDDGPCSWTQPSPASTPMTDPLYEALYERKYLSSVVWTGDAFVAVGFQVLLSDQQANALIVLSCDGSRWMPSDLPSQPGWLRSVAYGNDTLVATGERDPWNTDNTPIIVTRQRGGAWQTLNNTDRVGQLTFGNGVFVATHLGNDVIISTDAIRWEQVGVTEQINAIIALSFDGYRFIAYHDGVFQTSRDGRTWSADSTKRDFDACGPLTLVQDQVLGFCDRTKPRLSKWDDIPSYEVFVLQGQRGSDPDAWTVSAQTSLQYMPTALAASDDVLVALSGLRPLSTRLPFGTADWIEPGSLSIGLQMEDITRGASQFVLVGNAIYSSHDGQTWEQHAFP